jgi:two-component system response regulator AtoC
MKPNKQTILVADDDPLIREALNDRLESMGYQVVLALDGNQALQIIDKQTLHMMFLDIEMPGIKGMELLKEIRRREKDFPVVIITAYGTIDLAVEAMKEGAFDFIPKPFKGTHVALVVQRALDQQRLKQNIAVLNEEIDKRHQLIAGNSEKMNRAIAAAQKSAASSSSTVLLLGESGVGKELFARAIHNWSDRRERPFVAINCVGLSKDLLESELFGYERGAFTGAQQRKKGKFELADGGTVLLDEIGDISEALQTKLLRFLQEREFERVGGTELIRVDVRIIAATNRNLQAAVKEGRFRADLHFRINVVELALPSLRERKEDLPELVRHFIQRCASQSKRHFTDLSEEAMKKLLAYNWPGNVRELANVIERAVVLGQPPTIQVDDLPIEILATTEQRPAGAQLNHQESIDEHRREFIINALEQTHGNRTAAAKLLGYERAYFQKLIKALGIS